MRISGGKHLNRKIATNIKLNKNIEYRPTSDRSRQAVFNILLNSPKVDDSVIEGATVVDICSGCGSFSLEAISRGANKAYLIDNSKEQLGLAKLNAETLKENENCAFVKADAKKIPILGIQADLIFIDPPYECGFEHIILESIKKSGIINNNSIIILEVHKRFNNSKIKSFDILIEREYGKTKIIFMKLK